LASSRLTTCVPMNPEPPVMRILAINYWACLGVP